MSDNLDVSLPAPASDSQSKGPSLVQVNLRFTASQLSAIRQGVLNELDKTGGSNPGFSRTDIIIALLAHSFTQADKDSPPVDSAIVMFNVSTYLAHTQRLSCSSFSQHRGMGVAHDDAACNAIFWLLSEPFLQSHDKSAKHAVLAIATGLRILLKRIREIDNLHVHVAQQTALMKLPGFVEVGTQFIIPGPGQMSVNSVWRYGFLIYLSLAWCTDRRVS
jgi:hypothetical protein